MTDVPCAVGSMPCAIPEDTHGYLVEEAEVTYWGTCPTCARCPSDHLRHSSIHNFILTTGGQTSSQQPPLKE